MKKGNSTEVYLERILMLHMRKGFARSVDVATELDVTKPTVSIMMKRLREKNMIYFGDHGYIFLTDTGKSIAEEIYRKNRSLTRALMDIGVDEKNALEDACAIGCVISDKTYECLELFFQSHLKTVT